MKRREFLKGAATAMTGAAIASVGTATSSAAESAGSRKFKLLYAPHPNMFKNSAGNDVIDQIKFAADQGFAAWEDNGMKKRSPQLQEEVGRTLSSLGMKMGVFVAHTISWSEATLTTGNVEHRAKFLDEIRESVEVAKQVNATWMTVVPGHVDMRLHMDYQTANVIETLKQAAGILEPLLPK